jgi:peptidoglycan/xylan/chitin deacetylase (PgdA/CDA1 family)
MRIRPALVALTALVAVVVAGSGALHWLERPAEPARAAAADATAPEEAKASEPAQVLPTLTLPDPLPSRTVEVPILMYHRIAVLRGDEPRITRALTVDPGEFRLQMQWLKEHGFETITQIQLYEALMEGGDLPAKPIMLTFDDGYRGIATIAAPIMKQVGYVGTAYVITDRIARDPTRAPTWMTWSQLRALEQRGWDIGSHTVSHTEIPGLSEADALTTLRASRFALEKHLGHPVQWFCYPAGAVDAKSVEWVRQAGYVLATTTQEGDTHSARDPLRLSRVRVSDSTGVRGLAAALS